MIGKVRGRGEFQLLRSSRRRASAGPVRITVIHGDNFDRPCVAYAIGRKTGGAVIRNRLRRRLRSVAVDLAPEMQAGAYLISASAEAAALPYGELRGNVSAALTALANQDRR